MWIPPSWSSITRAVKPSLFQSTDAGTIISRFILITPCSFSSDLPAANTGFSLVSVFSKKVKPSRNFPQMISRSPLHGYLFD
ncbi:MAG: hypothetical protein AMS26_07740 [Bacteroides sp. SM23_62]|nr:MAG: hypothetical protein AMS26_07740 [Bacteroides sp. SM23_62]